MCRVFMFKARLSFIKFSSLFHRAVQTKSKATRIVLKPFHSEKKKFASVFLKSAWVVQQTGG